MARAFAKAALVAAALFVTWGFVTPAHAPPVAAAIVGFLGLSGVVATVATFVIETAISLGVSYVANKLFGPKPPSGGAQAAQERQASITQLQTGEQPRELVIGTAANAGTLAGAFNYGGQYGTDWVVKVQIVADHKCHALTGFFVNDAFVAYSADGVVDGYSNQLEVYWRDGSAGQAFPSALMSAWRTSPLHSDLAPASDTPYVGQAYIVFAYKADAPDAQSPVWSGAHPQFLPVIQGKLCYDPRKDTTVGGSGAHRWDTPSTWEWTDNLSVCRYNWVRGVYALDQVDDPSQLLVGRGLSTLEAPPANVFAYANLCDEDVDAGKGDDSTEKRYTANGVIRSTDSYLSVEQMFETASAGRIIQPQGGVEVEPGEAKTPVFSITDADMAQGQTVTFNAFGSDADRVNTVIPRYVEPTQHWADTAGEVQRDLDAVALDGPREFTLPMSLVTSPGQARRVAQIYLQGKLRERTATIPVMPWFAEAEEGDWIQWTSARHTGGNPVVFRITAFAQDQSYVSTWSLEETSFDVYGFGGAPLGGLTPADPRTPPGALALAGVTATPIQLTGSSGAEQPAIHFTWTTPTDPGITSIRAEIRKAGDTVISATPTSAPNLGVLNVTNGVGADMALEARLVPQGAPGRPVVPSDWIDVDTGQLVASSTSHVGDLSAEDIANAIALGQQTVQDLQDAIAEARKTSEAFTIDVLKNAKVLGALKKLGFTPDGLPLGPFAVEQKIRTDTTVEDLSLIGVRNGDGSAWEMSDTTFQIDGQAVADQLTLLFADFASNSASIATEASARASADSAEAISRLALASTVAANQASATSQFSTLSDAQSATASELHLLGAKNLAGTAFVFDMSKAQTAPGVSFGSRLSGIDSSISTNSAAIATESSARASGDSAVSSTVSTLSATVGGFSASISANSSAISDLQGRTQAYLSIVAAAGSDPAYLKLIATSYGSAIMLAAQSIGLFNVSAGTVLEVLKIVSGRAHVAKVLYIDGGGYRIMVGPAFGASSNITFWFGVDSIDETTATVSNSIFAFDTSGNVKGGGGGGGTLDLSVSPSSATWSGLASGMLETTTGSAPLVSVGSGSGSYQYAWAADGGTICNNPTGAGSTFSHYISAGEDFETTARCTVRDTVTGKVDWIEVPVGFADTH